jgi:hypothetical protein
MPEGGETPRTESADGVSGFSPFVPARGENDDNIVFETVTLLRSGTLVIGAGRAIANNDEWRFRLDIIGFFLSNLDALPAGNTGPAVR